MENFISLIHFKRDIVFFAVPNKKRYFNSSIHNDSESFKEKAVSLSYQRENIKP